MATLQEDIKKQSEWIVTAFKSDGYDLDYSLHSLIEIDRFLEKNLSNGRPKRGGRLSKNYGAILFAIASYVAQTLLQNIPGSKLITDDNDPEGEVNFSVAFGDNVCWPAQRVMKRVRNGLEDGIYPYGRAVAANYISDEFDESFWEIGNEEESHQEAKPWWKFW